MEPLKQRIATDPLAKQIHEAILKRAEAILKERTVRYEIPDGLRLLSESRAGITRVLHTGYAWRMTGEQRYFDRCVAELDAACALQDWNPKHFLDVGEMATAVAIGYDWLYPKLTAEQRQHYEDALAIKGIAAIPAKPPGWWQKPSNNWSQVCATGMMIAADAIQETRPEIAAPILDHTRRMIADCVTFYQPDGAYPEGPAYWHYGTSYQVLGMALAEREKPQKLDPIWTRTTHFVLHSTGPSGLAFNFADANPSQAEISPALSWLSTRTGDPLAIQGTRELLARRFADKRAPSDRFLPLTLLWLPKETKTVKPALDAVFKGEQALAFFRDSWTAEAFWLGIKGGTAAASHGQMDAGSFVLDWAGSRWVHDLGADNYNLPAYFGNKRFTYYRLQNLSHNTLVIDGKLQNPKAKPCPVTSIERKGSLATATIDLTDAYLDQCKEALRTVSFDASKREATLVDHVKEPVGPVRWQLITDAAITVTGNVATLKKGDRSLILTGSDSTLTWSVSEPKAPTPEEKENKGMQMLSIEAPGKGAVVLGVRISAK